MAFLNKLLPMLLAVAVSACYEDFIPTADTTPVLCLNSLITAGQPVEVEVSHTYMYNNPDTDISVYDAVVTVYVNGEAVDGSYVAAEGDRIRIVAESARYGRAEAEVTVPACVPIADLQFTPYDISYWKESGPGMIADISFNLRIDLTFDDPGRQVNYYRYSYIGYNKHADADDIYMDSGNDAYKAFCALYLGSFDYEAEPLFGEHIGVFESIMGGDSYGFTLFSDRQINGRRYTLHLQYDNMVYTVTTREYDEELLDCGLELMLSAVSPSYYNWCNYEWQCNNGPLGDLGDVGLGEPIWGYSNVSTGAGVVAAQSIAVRTISFKDFIRETLYTNQ